VAFCAVVAMLGRSRYKRVTRIVTLPDFQGLGIGTRLLERVCEHYHARGIRMGITATHPGVVNYCRESARWQFVRLRKTGHGTRQRVGERPIRSSAGRSVASFEYIGDRR
jgi:GNAT superfamily N-acetyltransferase